MLAELCRVMKVSTSGYYGWRKRLQKPPSLKRKGLAQLVKDCYFENRRRYGTRRIRKALAKQGVEIGRARVRRLMREQSLKAIQPKSFTPRTTDSRGVKAAPNLLAEVRAEAGGAGRIIIGEITYIRLRGEKFAYLAIWQNRQTSRLGGWSLSLEMTQELVISALRKAIRKGLVKRGALVHSGRGSQYASNGFRFLLQANGLRQSMSGKGNCYDNAQAESFFSRFKAELIEDGVFEDLEQARSEIFSYIEGYYNRTRFHSGLGYKSPLEFEMGLKAKNGGKIDSFLSTKS